MIENVSKWFPAWLDQHKASNPHNAWPAFEQAGYSMVYMGWIRAFIDLGVKPAEAEAASLKLQRQGEVWPVDHLARLLAILSPMVATRKAEAEILRRRRESAEWAIEQDARRAARDAFRKLPEADRETRMASIRRRYPALASFDSIVEWFAAEEWRGSRLPDPPPISEAPAIVRTIPVEAEEPPLTPGQVAFLDSLDEGQLAAVDAMTPRRRRQILAPHAAGFDRSLMSVLIPELGQVAPAATEAA
ncbi:hypothetical protein P12x_003021 [Tundrisphaera lichenicola]|uniref:hypothetical protein n=1 Tax=Tundrisphaera lichenicola TaxID=2029860 RepID=UPI003EBC84E3